MNSSALLDQGAACLAASLVAKSKKIETTRFIIDLWNDLKNKLVLDSRLDYLAILLTQGRLMDLKLNQSDCYEQVLGTIENIKRELIIALTYPILGEKNGTPILADSYIVRLNDISSAMLASAYTRLSSRVESAKQILKIWYKIREMDIVKDNTEYLIAMLGTSRINDLRKELEHPGGLQDIVESFRDAFFSLEPNFRVTKHDLASAYLTIAIVTQTPEIETSAEILEIWNKFRNEIEPKDSDLDITAAILTGGIIINRTIKIELDDIKDIFNRIRQKVQEMQTNNSD